MRGVFSFSSGSDLAHVRNTSHSSLNSVDESMAVSSCAQRGAYFSLPGRPALRHLQLRYQGQYTGTFHRSVARLYKKILDARLSLFHDVIPLATTGHLRHPGNLQPVCRAAHTDATTGEGVLKRTGRVDTTSSHTTGFRYNPPYPSGPTLPSWRPTLLRGGSHPLPTRMPSLALHAILGFS